MMKENVSRIPGRLREIIDDFQLSEGREKLELLLQFSEQMAPLPERLRNDKHDREQVHECMTPVFIFSDLKDGRLIFHLDIPKSAPTVRGFASILVQGLEGATPEEVLSVPADFYINMGLDKVLTHQRLNGISAILAHMKSLALKEHLQIRNNSG